MVRFQDDDSTLAEHSGNDPVVERRLDELEPEDRIDPRITAAELPSSEQLDEPYPQQLDEIIHHRIPPHEVEKEPIYIEFDKGDRRDPINFTWKRKWAITATACFFTGLSAATASTYSLGIDSMVRDLNCTPFQGTIGLSTYTLGFSLIPLVTSSFSEEFGRQPLYIVSAIGFALCHVVVAVAQNIQTVQIARFFAGAFGSTGSTMVGGTIADIWLPHERGLPMSIFSVAAIAATGMGPVAAGWIEMNHRLEWRWIQWIHLIVTGALIVAIPILMKETRSAVLLTRIAKRMRKETGNHRYRARVEDERASLKTLIYISCTRPIYLLLTEPTVASFSLWIGFAWGILYVLIESIAPVFKNLHHFNAGTGGLAFITLPIGAVLGYLTNLYQEKLYRDNYPKRGPEARLYVSLVAAILFPASMFIYAWCTVDGVPWIALSIGITLFVWACFVMYLAVFTYLADCYGPFASSALAGQSLCRNLLGMAFPLFTAQMYDKLTYKWANTLFALLAVLMIPIPYVLFFKGPVIRARSKFASQVMEKLTVVKSDSIDDDKSATA